MRCLALLLLPLMLASLQGCFPVVAAGVGTGAMMAQDRRSTGTLVDDQGIELRALEKVSSQYGTQVHVNITSYNRKVLISGEAPSKAIRSGVEAIVKRVANVRQVHNEMSVSGLSSLSSRSSDALITSNVKLMMMDDQRVDATKIKVVTERATVYLMGLVSRSEGNLATENARSARGVQRVVKLFEYLD